MMPRDRAALVEEMARKLFEIETRWEGCGELLDHNWYNYLRRWREAPERPDLRMGKIMAQAEAALAVAEAAIMADEREACAKAMCRWCAAGWHIRTGTAYTHTNPGGEWKRWPHTYECCEAAAIRARGEREDG